MAFLRIVEVLPPLFPVSRDRRDAIRLDAAMERFTEEVRSIRQFADLILVANVKNPGLLRIDAVQTAARLQEFLRVKASPVVVVRDGNRTGFLTDILTALSLGLDSIMIAWGDDHPASAGITNVRDFTSLAGAIRDADLLRGRARSSARLLAPVDVESLAYPRGAAIARERIRAGSDLLLAQPPTTDSEACFGRHAALVEKAGMKEVVLLGVFPFKDDQDVRRYERMFGWKLPKELHQAAREGQGSLNELARNVVRRLRSEGHPGVYLTTRGNPGLAETVLS